MRRQRAWVERGIFRDGERYGISYAARFDSGAVKRKRVLLDPKVKTVGAARKALRAALADTEQQTRRTSALLPLDAPGCPSVRRSHARCRPFR